MMDTPRGYALLTVVWLVAALTVTGGAVASGAGYAVATARNRIASTRAEWLAVGCVAWLRSAARDLAEESARTGEEWDDVWLDLDSRLSPPEVDGCAVDLRAAGVTLDVNSTSLAQLARLVAEMGVSTWSSDSIAAAIVDWRDMDDVPHPKGAESDWYARRGLASPPNRPLRFPEEIGAARGVDRVPGILRLLSTTREPVSLNHADPRIVASLPGLTSSGALAIARHRERGGWIRGLGDLAGVLGADDYDRLLEHLPALVSQATFAPAYWVATVRGRSGDPEVGYTIEVHLISTSPGVLIRGSREWDG